MLVNDAAKKFGAIALASADRFLYEMSRIGNYEERLKCLHFLRSFKERIDDIAPLISCKAVVESGMHLPKSVLPSIVVSFQ